MQVTSYAKAHVDRRTLQMDRCSEAHGRLLRLAGADVAVTVVTNGVPQYACRLVAGARAWGLGDGLPRGELEWVASEINDQLSSFAGGEDLLAPPPGRVS